MLRAGGRRLLVEPGGPDDARPVRADAGTQPTVSDDDDDPAAGGRRPGDVGDDLVVTGPRGVHGLEGTQRACRHTGPRRPLEHDDDPVDRGGMPSRAGRGAGPPRPPGGHAAYRPVTWTA